MLVIMCGSVQNQVNYIDGWLMVMQYAHMYVDRLIEPIVCQGLVTLTDRAVSLCVQLISACWDVSGILTCCNKLH